MGVFSGPTPSPEHLGWVESHVPGARVVPGPRCSEVRLPSSFHDARIVYHRYTTSTGKSSSTHYRTFLIAPLPPSPDWVLVLPHGCLGGGGYRFQTNEPVFGEAILACGTAEALKPALIDVAPTVLVLQLNRWKILPEDLGPVIRYAAPLLNAALTGKTRGNRDYVAAVGASIGMDADPVQEAENWFPSFRIPRGEGHLLLRMQPEIRLHARTLPQEEAKRWNRPPLTSLSARVRSHCTLKIFPQKFWHSIGRLFGYQDWTVGDAPFDGAFVVKSSAGDFARAFLEPEVRDWIRSMRDLGDGSLRIDVSLSSAEVRKDSNLKSEADIRLFVDLGARLFERIEPSLREVARVEILEAVTGTEGLCQVCGVPMEPGQDVVTCDRCRTPHHRECWEYLGGCATFGCKRV